MGEFQGLVCQLLGMEVANAGMYDGATALAEAALMACRLTGRRVVVAEASVSARYLEVDASTVLQWAQGGRLPAQREGDRWRFERSKIEGWLAQEKIK